MIFKIFRRKKDSGLMATEVKKIEEDIKIQDKENKEFNEYLDSLNDQLRPGCVFAACCCKYCPESIRCGIDFGKEGGDKMVIAKIEGPIELEPSVIKYCKDTVRKESPKIMSPEIELEHGEHIVFAVSSTPMKKVYRKYYAISKKRNRFLFQENLNPTDKPTPPLKFKGHFIR